MLLLLPEAAWSIRSRLVTVLRRWAGMRKGAKAGAARGSGGRRARRAGPVQPVAGGIGWIDG